MTKEEEKENIKILKGMLWDLGHTKEDSQHIVDFFIEIIKLNN